MTVTVRLFAVFRERLGRDLLELDLPDGASVADALAMLGKEPELSELIERMPVRIAVNRDYANDATALRAGDEIAIVPPVSGGAEDQRVHAQIREEPLDLDAISDLVTDSAAGAKVIFEGTTREVTRLEYEAYVEMAEEQMRAVLEKVLTKHGLTRIAAEHRIGAVPLSEGSVIVAASAPHRGDAFEGAREAIDSIKDQVPIWKKEVVEEGAVRQEKWVGLPAPADSSPGAS